MKVGTLSFLFYLVHIPVALDVSTLNAVHYRIIHGMILPGVLPDWCTSILLDFSGGSGSKVSAYNVGDPGSIPGSKRSTGEGNGNPLQYSCLEIPLCWENHAWKNPMIFQTFIPNWCQYLQGPHI